MLDYGLDDSFSSLTPKLHGRHPDDAFSEIPYEKGFQFLTYLESLVGEGPFQEFFRGYVRRFERQSITEGDLKSQFWEFLEENFRHREAKRIWR